MHQVCHRTLRGLLSRDLSLLLIVFGTLALDSPCQDSYAAHTAFITDPAVHALCGEEIALIGEPPIHGFGRTLEYKAQLVRRLVSECHYDAVFFESGMYDFVHIEQDRRAGLGVPDALISAAIGGLWANEEMQSLVPFLGERVNAGTLALGGLDDQLGAGTYASRGMPSDLVQALPGDERSRCLAVLQRHMLWQYTDDSPYGPVDKQKILSCLDAIEERLPSRSEDVVSVSNTRAMIESLKRNFARDFTGGDLTKKEQEVRSVNDRDRSMYLNFRWLMGRRPPHSKVIVWAATVHTAKSLHGVEGFDGRVPLGAYVFHDYGRKAFSLGFSAYSGDYAFTHHPVQHLGDAPPSSLEGRSFARSDSDVVYLSRKQLHTYHAVAARLLGISLTTARWDQIVDGVVLFREERAPKWIRR